MKPRPTTRCIRFWMRHNLTDYVDLDTGEVNLTELAEACCRALNGYEGDEVPETYFELAFEVAEGR